MMNLPSSVTVCEVGLRDGLQNEKTIPTTEEKLTLLRGLIAAGFKVIEVGSFMHPKKVPQMADTDELFKAQTAAEQLRAQIKGYLDQASKAQAEVSELKREIFRLQQRQDNRHK